jgi:transcriptional regulator with XRE-family HTH domain
MTNVTPIRPPEPEHDLGELIRSYRLYVGLSQRGMAEKLNMARRSYQRIETSVDPCPPGLLADVEKLANHFEHHIDCVLAESERTGGVTIKVDTDAKYEWERSVAGRAAIVALGEPKCAPIILTMTDERSA